ncbi:nuclear transport factor 2 family protein [Yinghuangia sp. ASG 101]|uniref:nuclear transport factor 2 family protein n=1 Tax=Yinghuangia sp. ASG 101 TaxID=2896848 RepID=UPI001E654D8A|nr:nuclear transport factor 2 family protein [Yinghuangia sp. ASG 101]UGQ12628.1 nuclear transport factor 2 family protein [Yinghuangia sp. ASG 101]
MDDIAALTAVEAIKQLKARYFRTLDTKDWDGMREVFTEDVVVDTTGSGGAVVTGRGAFMEFVSTHLADILTVHHGHTPEITLTSPTTATGVWAMEDRVRYPDGRELIAAGHYHETYDKSDGTWRIKTSKLTRLFMDLSEPAAG